jgi:hypothetical protein
MNVEKIFESITNLSSSKYYEDASSPIIKRALKEIYEC